ncbi:hypothetical protein PACTADRAFT_4240 [Pachysolen tannophilus NRRL Y-2460]|uniref:Cytochrome c oxidase assembly factor 3 n=1 Tax=Pachysolen tannophilus NRRL Y-2460 TaxID=669874 RepID=A0A1E4TRA6_PACTA|nr:hypothetical protein PACTADRAFT_4240 [Pachysolen tannophilus NRRL Y-2460]
MRATSFRSAVTDQYHSKYNYTMTPAMLRARKPYFWRNTVSLFVLGGISLSVYVYTYSFLMKDDFEDIPIPPISDEDLAKLKKEYEANKLKDAALKDK